jgi:hypothetical protein
MKTKKCKECPIHFVEYDNEKEELCHRCRELHNQANSFNFKFTDFRK